MQLLSNATGFGDFTKLAENHATTRRSMPRFDGGRGLLDPEGYTESPAQIRRACYKVCARQRDGAHGRLFHRFRKC